MKLLWSSILLALAFATPASAQDQQVMVKNKGGVLTVKDKTKPVRRELEAVFAKRVQAVKSIDATAQIDLISPDYSATEPGGQTLNYEDIKNYIRRGAAQFVEVGDLTITIESLTARGQEAVVEARQYFPRTQRLRDGKIHNVVSTVLQTETWVKTAVGWKLKAVSNEREKTVTVDGKPLDSKQP